MEKINLAEQFEKLAELKKEGLITEEEFTTAKETIILLFKLSEKRDIDSKEEENKKQLLLG